MRRKFTLFLIRLAMKTCVNGFAYDALKVALADELQSYNDDN